MRRISALGLEICSKVTGPVVLLRILKINLLGLFPVFMVLTMIVI